MAAVNITCDIPYGTGLVDFPTAPRNRPLLMDMYWSGVSAGSSKPCLILGHGGANHRGNKEDDRFEGTGFFNTPVAEYCERFARRGYVCFSVGYRLTTELPAPQVKPIKLDRTNFPRARTNEVRRMRALPPASTDELLNGLEASFSDMAAACMFVASNATQLGIDNGKIALGGFSAGGIAALYAKYGLGAPATALVSISGGMDADDCAAYISAANAQIPILLVHAEKDLLAITDRTLALAYAVSGCEGRSLAVYRVPDAGHFYPIDSIPTLQESSIAGMKTSCSVEAAIVQFLTTCV